MSQASAQRISLHILVAPTPPAAVQLCIAVAPAAEAPVAEGMPEESPGTVKVDSACVPLHPPPGLLAANEDADCVDDEAEDPPSPGLTPPPGFGPAEAGTGYAGPTCHTCQACLHVRISHGQAPGARFRLSSGICHCIRRQLFVSQTVAQGWQL